MYLDFVVMPRLTSYLPLTLINVSDINILMSIELADPTFNSPNKIDMIVDSEIFFELICANELKLMSYGPTFQKTLFDYVVIGLMYSPIERIRIENTSISLVCSMSLSLTIVEEQIAKFWQLEEIQC